MTTTMEDVMRSLGRIEGTQTEILRRLDARDEDDEDREKRIASLERSRSWMAGLGTVITILLGSFEIWRARAGI